MSNFYKQSVLNKTKVDLFTMVFQIPAALRKINKKEFRSSNTILEDSMSMSIYGTVVPDIVVPALQIPFAGSNLYNSTHAKEAYPPVSVNFTIDNSFNNYWVIFKWLNLLHDQKSGLFDTDNLISDDVFSDYQTDISIFGLDEFQKQRIHFKYTKAFPTTLGGIKYSQRDSSEAESQFTFVYSQLHAELLNT